MTYPGEEPLRTSVTRCSAEPRVSQKIEQHMGLDRDQLPPLRQPLPHGSAPACQLAVSSKATLRINTLSIHPAETLIRK